MRRFVSISIILSFVLMSVFAGISVSEETARTVPGDLDEVYTATVRLYPGQDYYIMFDNGDLTLSASDLPQLP